MLYCPDEVGKGELSSTFLFGFLSVIQMDRLERNSGVDQREIIDVRLCFNSGL